jgi:predicted enzyme related to lactoylglutathione lyase
MKPTSMYFMIEVSDMDRAVAFYRDAIGLEVKLHTPYWSSLSLGDATLGLHPGRAGDEQRDVGLGIDVPEAQVELNYQQLEAAGATIVEPVVKKPTEGIWLGRVADPEGNVIMVTASIGE